MFGDAEKRLRELEGTWADYAFVLICLLGPFVVLGSFWCAIDTTQIAFGPNSGIDGGNFDSWGQNEGSITSIEGLRSFRSPGGVGLDVLGTVSQRAYELRGGVGCDVSRRARSPLSDWSLLCAHHHVVGKPEGGVDCDVRESGENPAHALAVDWSGLCTRRHVENIDEGQSAGGGSPLEWLCSDGYDHMGEAMLWSGVGYDVTERGENPAPEPAYDWLSGCACHHVTDTGERQKKQTVSRGFAGGVGHDCSKGRGKEGAWWKGHANVTCVLPGLQNLRYWAQRLLVAHDIHPNPGPDYDQEGKVITQSMTTTTPVMASDSFIHSVSDGGGAEQYSDASLQGSPNLASYSQYCYPYGGYVHPYSYSYASSQHFQFPSYGSPPPQWPGGRGGTPCDREGGLTSHPHQQVRREGQRLPSEAPSRDGVASSSLQSRRKRGPGGARGNAPSGHGQHGRSDRGGGHRGSMSDKQRFSRGESNYRQCQEGRQSVKDQDNDTKDFSDFSNLSHEQQMFELMSTVVKIDSRTSRTENWQKQVTNDLKDVKATLVSTREATLINRNEIGALNKRLDQMERELESFHLERAKSNLRFFNIEESGSGENCKQLVVEILKFYYSDFVWNSDMIVAAYRLGAAAKSRGARPILVRFRDEEYAKKVLVNMACRRGMEEDGIKVAQERTRKQEAVLKQLRSEGKYAYYYRGRLRFREPREDQEKGPGPDSALTTSVADHPRPHPDSMRSGRAPKDRRAPARSTPWVKPSNKTPLNSEFFDRSQSQTQRQEFGNVTRAEDGKNREVGQDLHTSHGDKAEQAEIQKPVRVKGAGGGGGVRAEEGYCPEPLVSQPTLDFAGRPGLGTPWVPRGMGRGGNALLGTQPPPPTKRPSPGRARGRNKNPSVQSPGLLAQGSPKPPQETDQGPGGSKGSPKKGQPPSKAIAFNKKTPDLASGQKSRQTDLKSWFPAVTSTQKVTTGNDGKVAQELISTKEPVMVGKPTCKDGSQGEISARNEKSDDLLDGVKEGCNDAVCLTPNRSQPISPFLAESPLTCDYKREDQLPLQRDIDSSDLCDNSVQNDEEGKDNMARAPVVMNSSEGSADFDMLPPNRVKHGDDSDGTDQFEDVEETNVDTEDRPTQVWVEDIPDSMNITDIDDSLVACEDDDNPMFERRENENKARANERVNETPISGQHRMTTRRMTQMTLSDKRPLSVWE